MRDVPKMSDWTHLICVECWDGKNPERPASNNPAVQETHEGPPCCFCSKPTSSRIYTRADPSQIACKGTGPEHEG